jgi:hypothetical protein
MSQMSKEKSNQDELVEQSRSLRQYSHPQELINNLPYIAMIALGTAVLFVGINTILWKWAAATAYLIYGVAGVFWIILFLCPFCRYYDTRFCPCGYGRIAAKLRKQGSLDPGVTSAEPGPSEGIPQDCFDEKFRKHIPVIVPLWFIPILVGVPLWVSSFSLVLLVLMVVFALNSFVILPLFSTRHGCKECPQQDSCPWMRNKRKGS